MIPMRAVCMCGSCVGVSDAIATVTRPRGAASTGPAPVSAASVSASASGTAMRFMMSS